MSEYLDNMTGMQDGFERLWTPHRLVYIEDLQKPKTDDCVFCDAPNKSDEDGLIVKRGVTAYVLLNLFPYNLFLLIHKHVQSLQVLLYMQLYHLI